MNLKFGVPTIKLRWRLRKN